MTEYIEAIQRLAEQFGRLSGVGRKTAIRMAFSVIELDAEAAEEFAAAIIEAKQKIHECPICGNLTDKEICSVCADDQRNKRVICVVEDARTLLAMEKVRDYRGTYHVLGGLISPMKGVSPESINLPSLVERVKSAMEAEDGGRIEEVILALGATVEGDATAMYIARILSSYGVRVTRLAYGIPVGSDLEYADEVTLFRALQGRTGI